MTRAAEIENNQVYVADKPQETVKVFAATKERVDLSPQIAAMYTSALGKGGVQTDGHEAYPDADLFSEEGVKATIEGGERTIVVAAQVDESGAQQPVAGAMVMDRLSPYHVEFNSMAVAMERRGLRLGTKIVEGLRDLVDETDFTVNATELVTHSMASQAAHFGAGYQNICGFGFCQYPRVFFKEHPESVLWVVRLQGKLVSRLRQLRATIGRALSDNIDIVQQKVLDAQMRFASSQSYQRLDERQLALVSTILSTRTCYVPGAYRHLVESILFQFEDTLDRVVKSENDMPALTDGAPNQTEESGGAVKKATGEKASFDVELKEGFGHSYIIYKSNFDFDATAIDKAITDLKAQDKRFILVRIPAHNPGALALANHLRAQGFVFHSYLPLYGHHPEDTQTLGDILTVQWVKPDVVAQNALPGETSSVIKLYGYPQNLSGPLIRTIASELALAGKGGAR